MLLLRGPRTAAASPDIETLAARTHLAPEQITHALTGPNLPDWETTRAIVGALHGQHELIRPLWNTARATMLSSRAATTSTCTTSAGASGDRAARATHPRSCGAPGIVLPAAFRAFHTLQESTYRAYVDAHITPAGSGPVLGEAFGQLAACWSQIMLRTDPVAYAWDLFTTAVHARAARIPIPVASRL